MKLIYAAFAAVAAFSALVIAAAPPADNPPATAAPPRPPKIHIVTREIPPFPVADVPVAVASAE